jgi:hypothetical protein
MCHDMFGLQFHPGKKVEKQIEYFEELIDVIR